MNNSATLLLDIGNSRLKWALLRAPLRRAAPFVGQGAIDLAAMRGTRALRQLFALVDARTRVYISNVAGADIEQAVRTASARAGLAPHWVRSRRRFGDVINGYEDPWRLGVDRWLSLVGAHFEYPARRLCIVGVGTALTIDLLGADGRHHGGSIIPGPQLMLRSLLDHTAGIRRRAGGTRAALQADVSMASPFASNTRTALHAGASHACAALIERACAAGTRQLGGRLRLIIGGGGANDVAALLQRPFERNDELVLRGLAVVAESAT